jgi:hypothetical protein
MGCLWNDTACLHLSHGCSVQLRHSRLCCSWGRHSPAFATAHWKHACRPTAAPQRNHRRSTAYRRANNHTAQKADGCAQQLHSCIYQDTTSTNQGPFPDAHPRQACLLCIPRVRCGSCTDTLICQSCCCWPSCPTYPQHNQGAMGRHANLKTTIMLHTNQPQRCRRKVY